VGSETYTRPTPAAVSIPTSRWGTGPGAVTGPTRHVAGPPVLPAPRQVQAEPRLRQLMGVCGWAAILGGVGLVIGIRGLLGVLAGTAPGWYETAMVLTGLLGNGLTIGAFLTVARDRIPWLLLTGASATLVVAMALTSIAF
jgi:hypothetical protein